MDDDTFRIGLIDPTENGDFIIMVGLTRFLELDNRNSIVTELGSNSID